MITSSAQGKLLSPTVNFIFTRSRYVYILLIFCVSVTHSISILASNKNPDPFQTINDKDVAAKFSLNNIMIVKILMILKIVMIINTIVLIISGL